MSDIHLTRRPNMRMRILSVGLSVLAGAWLVQAAAQNIDSKNLISGQAAFVDYRSMKPGVFRKITAADLPKPYATESARNFPTLVPRPADAWPHAPAGFTADL